MRDVVVSAQPTRPVRTQRLAVGRGRESALDDRTRTEPNCSSQHIHSNATVHTGSGRTGDQVLFSPVFVAMRIARSELATDDDSGVVRPLSAGAVLSELLRHRVLSCPQTPVLGHYRGRRSAVYNNLVLVVSLCGGSVAEWLACWTQAQKGPDSNRSRDAVG